MVDKDLMQIWSNITRQQYTLQTQAKLINKIWLAMNKALFENRISCIERKCVILQKDGTEKTIFWEYEPKIEVYHRPINRMLNNIIADVLTDNTITKKGIDATPLTEWQIVQTAKIGEIVKVVKERKVDIDNFDENECEHQRAIFPAKINEYIVKFKTKKERGY